jgi:phosphotransferase system HPr (HPr) family protein
MSHPFATRTVVVSLSHGLHMRPSLAIVNTVAKFQSSVEIRHQQHAANAKSIFDLLLLAAPRDTELVLTATGPDADQAASAVAELFARDFESSPIGVVA